MPDSHPNARLEAFCDGVFAIAITLLVIDIRIPDAPEIETDAGLWHGLRHAAPAISAFVLSFGVILITWVNHHNHMKLVNRSCDSFLYSNGFLLLVVAFIPFPTSLLGEHLLTGHATPAVVLYNAVLALQATGWVLISHTAIKNRLAKSEQAAGIIRKNGQFGLYAFILYSLLAFAAFRFPLTSAVVTTLTWIFWLIYGINIKHREEE